MAIRIIIFKKKYLKLSIYLNILIIRMTNRVEQMMKVHDEALELFKRKNADYGDAFADYGTVGVIMRMGDKIRRLSSITSTGVNLVNTESLRDTLIDLHNYSAMAIMLLDEDKKNS
jgi:Lon protease-like protein